MGQPVIPAPASMATPSKKPPMLSGALPVLGHAVEFGRNAFGLLQRARDEAGDVLRLAQPPHRDRALHAGVDLPAELALVEERETQRNPLPAGEISRLLIRPRYLK